ncbi:MAG TPA: crossover junction endodeoxyribonuclease RuvC [Candidatus Cloacimonadota bacterium]|nr:crossover junction endodeoxyribonuclease RuvC [Candidatus Cloacimonadota bacterium]HOQ80986.1 crossover junction endodeoxyribonuclease RuvC [Candidatus Cloacimonadota bacterium]
MIIMGIDPGSRNCGYGFLEVEKHKILAAGCGVIKNKDQSPLSERLLIIYNKLKAQIEENKPDVAAVESIFYAKNIKSSFTLGHVRGVILLLLAEYGIPCYEYSPREIKLSVVGSGSASKKQVLYMIQSILQLKQTIITYDASDALAIAMCLYNREKLNLFHR